MFLGSLLGDTSPVATATPLLGAELLLEPGAHARPRRRPGVRARRARRHRRGRGRPAQETKQHELAYVAARRRRLALGAHGDAAGCCSSAAPPFGEPIVMWWNFVGRSHEEVVAFREAVAGPARDGGGRTPAVDGRFGVVGATTCRRSRRRRCPNARLKERH